MKNRIETLEDLCNHFNADEPSQLNRGIYNATSCGASISVLHAPEDPREFSDLVSYEEPIWIHCGDAAWQHLTVGARILAFTIQTIIEGSDATVASEPFVLPVKSEDVSEWIEYMEAEASLLWDEANSEESYL